MITLWVFHSKFLGETRARSQLYTPKCCANGGRNSPLYTHRSFTELSSNLFPKILDFKFPFAFFFENTKIFHNFKGSPYEYFETRGRHVLWLFLARLLVFFSLQMLGKNSLKLTYKEFPKV